MFLVYHARFIRKNYFGKNEILFTMHKIEFYSIKAD